MSRYRNVHHTKDTSQRTKHLLKLCYVGINLIKQARSCPLIGNPVGQVCPNSSVSHSHILGMAQPRRGKTGGSGRVRVGSTGFAGQTGHGSKRVIFNRVNRVTGQSGFGSGRVDPYFSNFFFFFFQLQKD